jgi:hypothetical protein
MSKCLDGVEEEANKDNSSNNNNKSLWLEYLPVEFPTRLSTTTQTQTSQETLSLYLELQHERYYHPEKRCVWPMSASRNDDSSYPCERSITTKDARLPDKTLELKPLFDAGMDQSLSRIENQGHAPTQRLD